MSTEVSVIIVSWNCRQMLADCIQSLQAQLPEGSSEIIVVDNASSDGTVEAIRASFPELTLIASKANQGFARGNNAGITISKGKYICLINPDVVVGDRCIAQLLEYMEQHANVGMVGPKIIGRDGETQRSCMRTPTLWNQLCRTLGLDTLTKSSRLFGGYLMKDFHFDELREVEIINGCFWMIRREALESVGNLDQRFWMYGEDLDWCERFRLAGWKLAFFPDAKAVHFGGISSEQASVRCYVEMQRADLQYWRKYHSVLSYACYFGLLCTAHSLRSFVFACAFALNPSSSARVLMRLRKHLACMRWLIESTGLGKAASA